jgi:hypothetical protein
MHIIDEKLQDLECPVSLFVPIAQIIGRTRLTQCLQNERPLDRSVIDKLVTLLDEMAELKRTALVAPDWSDAEGRYVGFGLQEPVARAGKDSPGDSGDLSLLPAGNTLGTCDI